MVFKKLLNILKGKSMKYEKFDNPFFILGCVRSGTTMLRDMLREVDHLYSPEETHFFRDGDPYATQRYENAIIKNSILKEHRAIDGISEKEFNDLVDVCKTKHELMDKYMALFVTKKTDNKYARWYDKTPQNIYGISLISKGFPTAKFIHIYRNPLNVAASLKLGKVMPPMSVTAAANYWLESMILVDTYKKIAPERIYEIQYESLLQSPNKEFTSLLKFLDIDAKAKDFSDFIKPETDKYKKILSAQEQNLVLDICEEYSIKYGYTFKEQ